MLHTGFCESIAESLLHISLWYALAGLNMSAHRVAGFVSLALNDIAVI